MNHADGARPVGLVGSARRGYRVLGAAFVGLVIVLASSACGTAAPAARGGASSTAVPAPPTPPFAPAATAAPSPSPTSLATGTPGPSSPVRATEPPPTAAATVDTDDTAPPGSAVGASRVVEYGESGRREIALTFDAGADRGYAAEILDLLAAERITASFGLLGQWAEANPDLVQRMVDGGHLLFNHSWSHPSFTGRTTETAPLTAMERLAEVRRTETTVRDLTGYDLRPYFRPPYGDWDESVLADLGDAGYGVTLLWSCDSRDSLGAAADEIMANCIEAAAPGRIVLLHVGAQSAAYETLPQMIASLRAQGFAFVTVEEIIQP